MVANISPSDAEVLNADELAARIKKSRASVYRDARNGLIPSVRIGTSVRFIWPLVVAALVAGTTSANP